MILETYNQATELIAQIRELDKQLERISSITDREKGSTVKVGVTGQVLDIPATTIIAKLNSKKQELETEKAQLEKEFNDL